MTYPSDSSSARRLLASASVLEAVSSRALRELDPGPDEDLAPSNRAWLAHFNRIVDLGTLFHEITALLDSIPADEEGAESERLWNTMQIFAYLIVVHDEGWKQFCGGMNTNANEFVRAKPGGETVERIVASARPLAPSPRAALAIMRKRNGEGIRPLTPEGIARTLCRHLDGCIASGNCRGPGQFDAGFRAS